MATQAQIDDLRELVNEEDDTGGWTDVRLGEYIDSSTSLNSAASKVWLAKATEYSKLVDVTESGSSRKMSDLQKNALALADRFGSLASDEVVVASNRPRTRAIVRP